MRLMRLMRAYNGYLNAGPVHHHMRNLERHDNDSCPFAYTFDDPAVERAYDVAQFYLNELQGEWFARQYEEAWRRGEI